MVSQRCASPSEEAEVDPMVKIELEAAEALADLALRPTRDSELDLDFGGKWGTKGKRAVKRVKTESPVHADSTDQAEDQAVVSQQQCDDLGRNVVINPITGEQEADLNGPCSTNYSSFGGGRSRHILTETEKEARRIRRILANRESARQTIRRRQALCEDLAKKADDLSWENENLKKEKDLALKVYQSLDTTNRHLKEQVAQARKAGAEETQGEGTRPSQGDVPTNCPLLLYNRPPFTPLFWPAIVHSNTSQSQPGAQNTACLPSNDPVSATRKTELTDIQENLININGSRTPLYLLPCPWFIPLSDHHGNGLHPQPFFAVMNKQDENSSRNVGKVEINSLTFVMKTKTTDSGSIEVRPINGLNDTLVGYPQNGVGYTKIAQSKEIVPASASASTDKHTESDFVVNDEATSPQAGQIVGSLSEQNEEPDMHSSKRLMIGIAAAEARRRRKELTKLKNLHGRKCRMHC